MHGALTRTSNFLHCGGRPREKKGTHYSGVTRFVSSHARSSFSPQLTKTNLKIEYIVACFDDKNRKVRLSLRQADILQALANNEKLKALGGGVPDIDEVEKPYGASAPVFHPEFGRFMLEATPGKPWGIGFKDLLGVEPDMKRRLARENGSQSISN